MRLKHLLLGALAAGLALPALATDVTDQYFTSKTFSASKIEATVHLCASSDGSYTAVPCGGTTMVTTSATSSLVVRAAPGDLIDVYAGSATAGSLLVFDATTPPAANATGLTPRNCIPVPAGGTNGVSFGSAAEPYVVGIAAVYSTGGCFTYTPANAFIHGSWR